MQNLFPNGLDWLKDQIPIPVCVFNTYGPSFCLLLLQFVLYSSYFTPSNVYTEKFPFIDSEKFNVGWASGQVAVADPNNSFAFYDYIMSSQAHNLGGFEASFSITTSFTIYYTFIR